MQPDELATAPGVITERQGRGAKAQWALQVSVALVVTNVLLVACCIWGSHEGPLSNPRLLTGIIFWLLFSSLVQACVGLFALLLPGARIGGAIALVLAPLSGYFAFLAALSGGAGWGRPLRVRGRQLHPELRRGADWTRGEQPSAQGLSAATRNALEALWLHDAQKEHASVPAFARIAWMLAAVGAPAELLAWAQHAALQEIDHARRCFALAAGYGGRSHSVEAMPDLLLSGLDMEGDPFEVLARESLQDGCQLEDFNADVAAACALVCEEPATRAVLQQIAREERSHAEFSWAVLEWCLERSPEGVSAVIADAERSLHKLVRPHAVSGRLWLTVAKADAGQMLRHGRLPDQRWGELWDERVAGTRERLKALTVGSLREPTLQVGPMSLRA